MVTSAEESSLKKETNCCFYAYAFYASLNVLLLKAKYNTKFLKKSLLMFANNFFLFFSVRSLEFLVCLSSLFDSPFWAQNKTRLTELNNSFKPNSDLEISLMSTN